MSNDVLDWMEVMDAAVVAVMRAVRRRAQGAQHKWGAPMVGGWERGIEGACAEKFASKTLGLPWHNGREGRYDVGSYQIRQTSYLNGRLCLHPEDLDEDVFILVVGTAPSFKLVGWCYGHEGKQTEYWQDPQGTNRWAFWVPREFPPMRKMETLTKEKIG